MLTPLIPAIPAPLNRPSLTWVYHHSLLIVILSDSTLSLLLTVTTIRIELNPVDPVPSVVAMFFLRIQNLICVHISLDYDYGVVVVPVVRIRFDALFLLAFVGVVFFGCGYS